MSTDRRGINQDNRSQHLDMCSYLSLLSLCINLLEVKIHQTDKALAAQPATASVSLCDNSHGLFALLGFVLPKTVKLENSVEKCNWLKVEVPSVNMCTCTL